jgi:hypothetical protein
MAIADDFTISYAGKTVTHTSGTTIYTVLAFFQWLAATFANQTQMDDDYAFLSDTPTVYRWTNGWAFGTASNDIKYLKGGSVQSADGNDAWSNMYSIGAQESGTQLYIIQNDAELSGWWSTGNIDILVLVKSGGTWIQSDDTGGTPADGGLWVYAREWGDKYDHNFVDLSGLGRNPVGINTSADLDNATAQATVSGYSDVSITFGAVQKDLNNGDGLQPYDCVVDGNGRTVTQVYERLKYVCRYGEVDIQLNSDDGQEYRSASEGSYTDVKSAPFGTFAGGTIYGARGIWIENCLTSDFSLIDSDGDIQNPPNYQKVAVNHTTLSGCQIFVAEISAGDVVKDQYVVSTAGADYIDATLTIDINSVPQSGGLRVADVAYIYTSISGVRFIGVSPNPSAETGNFYVPLLDVLADATQELSDNIIYNTNISVRTTVRKYGYKEYTADTTFTSTGLTFSPILTEDPQAT